MICVWYCLRKLDADCESLSINSKTLGRGFVHTKGRNVWPMVYCYVLSADREVAGVLVEGGLGLGLKPESRRPAHRGSTASKVGREA